MLSIIEPGLGYEVQLSNGNIIHGVFSGVIDDSYLVFNTDLDTDIPSRTRILKEHIIAVKFWV